MLFVRERDAGPGSPRQAENGGRLRAGDVPASAVAGCQRILTVIFQFLSLDNVYEPKS